MCPSTGPLVHRSVTAASTARGSCFTVRTSAPARESRSFAPAPSSDAACPACPPAGWLRSSIPIRPSPRNRDTAPSKCPRFPLAVGSTLPRVWSTAAATCGEICLAAGAVASFISVVSSSGVASGDTVVASTGGWRHGERNLASVTALRTEDTPQYLSPPPPPPNPPLFALRFAVSDRSDWETTPCTTTL
jgi:hypothetical protein